MKRSTLLRPVRRRSLAPVALLLTLAVLVNGAVPPRTAAASTIRAAAADNRQAAFEEKADAKLRMIYRIVTEARGGKEGRITAQAERRAFTAKFDHLITTAGVAITSEGAITVRLTVDLSGVSEKELTAAGFQVGASIGDIATVETELDQLPRLAALASVERMSAITTAYPTWLVNDEARKSIGVDNPTTGARALQQTGKGVVVGIIDRAASTFITATSPCRGQTGRRHASRRCST